MSKKSGQLDRPTPETATQNIYLALRTLGGNIAVPAPDDTMSEMVLQTSGLCLDAADRLETLAKATTGLAAGRKYWKTRARMAEQEVIIAKTIALAALDKVVSQEAEKKLVDLIASKTPTQIKS